MNSTPNNQPQTSTAPHLTLQQGLVVAVILLLVMVAWLVDSIRKMDALNNDFHVVATMVAKDLNPTLYLRDVNYATDQLYRFYTPTYRTLLGWLWQTSGTFEWGLIWLMPLVLGGYLIGMLWLSFRVTKDIWIALGVTVASAAYYETMGQEIWGSGSSTLMLARTLFTATVPFLTLLILQCCQQQPSWRQMLGLGAALGLTANLHPPSGLHLTIAAASLLILLHGWREQWLRFWLKLLAMSLASLVGVWPTLLNYVRGTGRTDLGTVEFETLYTIVSEWYDLPFRPDKINLPALDISLTATQLEPLVWLGYGAVLLGLGSYFWTMPRTITEQRWLWLIGGLLTVVYALIVALFNHLVFFSLVALYVIYRFVLLQTTKLDGILMGWLAIIVAQSFLGYYLIVHVWEYTELVSLTTLVGEQPRAARFVYLPLYLLVGLAGVAAVNRLTQTVPQYRQATAVVIAFLIALTPGISTLMLQRLDLGRQALLLLIGAALLVWSIVRYSPPILTRWYPLVAVIGIAVTLFGPPASWLSPYLHLPAVNLLDPVARAADLRYQPHDQQLYDWAKNHTQPQEIFFWCHFGPTTTLHFRLKAERGLTHNWRDLNQRTYNPGTLVEHHARYRQFEAACQNPFTTVAAAQEAQADFILVSSDKTAEFTAESCFFNERYAVFPVHPKNCP